MIQTMMINPQCILEDINWINNDNIVTYEKHGTIAIIPIHGLLTQRREDVLPIWGGVSYEEIYTAISNAHDDPNISEILLDIDSPGGDVAGLFDLVDFIYNTRHVKPISAFANTSAFSAAYAIASATSHIYITRASGVGSIGVIATHTDISQADTQSGIKYNSIIAGAKKNNLSPHNELTPEARQELQNEVNRLYDIFVDTVSRNRNLSNQAIRDTEAGCFYGDNAVLIGLVDSVVSGITWDFLDKTGGKMQKEESENKYKAEILEIVKLCKLAQANDRLSGFIEEGLTAEEVKEKLLTTPTNQQHISAIHTESQAVNPLLTAINKRIH